MSAIEQSIAQLDAKGDDDLLRRLGVAVIFARGDAKYLNGITMLAQPLRKCGDGRSRAMLPQPDSQISASKADVADLKFAPQANAVHRVGVDEAVNDPHAASRCSITNGSIAFSVEAVGFQSSRSHPSKVFG